MPRPVPPASLRQLEEAGATAVHELDRDLRSWIANVFLPKVARIRDLERQAQIEQERRERLRPPRDDSRLSPEDRWLLRQGTIYLQGWDAHPGLINLVVRLETYLAQ
jgi:hypothetical protein